MTIHASPVQALIVVDVQKAFTGGDGALPDAARLVDRTAGLIARARSAGALVVHVQNDGDTGAPDEPGAPGWELHHPVGSGPAEVVVRKSHDDAFQETGLGDLLTSAGVEALAVCGLMSEMCVQATARTAVALAYRVVLPHDAHATYDIPAEPGISPVVPAAAVSRVAAWPLSRDADVTARAADVTFTAPPRSRG
ncbi:cysteine hydrolase family protein [Streptomyces sp. NPDC086010]|uniref:cysteine hydrolase family protein n=1 Tax=Streptomyces sp. NPDC086010 TaxID=3365745 RepID=UPI0037D33F36